MSLTCNQIIKGKETCQETLGCQPLSCSSATLLWQALAATGALAFRGGGLPVATSAAAGCTLLLRQLLRLLLPVLGGPILGGPVKRGLRLLLTLHRGRPLRPRTALLR